LGSPHSVSAVFHQAKTNPGDAQTSPGHFSLASRRQTLVRGKLLTSPASSQKDDLRKDFA
jgi:hypothetical protein